MEEKSELENELMRSTSPKPSEPNGSKGNECEQRETRALTKENLYMVLALWMEEFPVVEQTSSAKRLNKVGVVFDCQPIVSWLPTVVAMASTELPVLWLTTVESLKVVKCLYPGSLVPFVLNSLYSQKFPVCSTYQWNQNQKTKEK